MTYMCAFLLCENSSAFAYLRDEDVCNNCHSRQQSSGFHPWKKVTDEALQHAAWRKMPPDDWMASATLW